jgi:hypothetical protein
MSEMYTLKGKFMMWGLYPSKTNMWKNTPHIKKSITPKCNQPNILLSKFCVEMDQMQRAKNYWDKSGGHKFYQIKTYKKQIRADIFLKLELPMLQF